MLHQEQLQKLLYQDNEPPEDGFVSPFTGNSIENILLKLINQYLDFGARLQPNYALMSIFSQNV